MSSAAPPVPKAGPSHQPKAPAAPKPSAARTTASAATAPVNSQGAFTNPSKGSAAATAATPKAPPRPRAASNRLVPHKDPGAAPAPKSTLRGVLDPEPAFLSFGYSMVATAFLLVAILIIYTLCSLLTLETSGNAVGPRAVGAGLAEQDDKLVLAPIPAGTLLGNPRRGTDMAPPIAVDPFPPSSIIYWDRVAQIDGFPPGEDMDGRVLQYTHTTLRWTRLATRSTTIVEPGSRFAGSSGMFFNVEPSMIITASGSPFDTSYSYPIFRLDLLMQLTPATDATGVLVFSVQRMLPDYLTMQPQSATPDPGVRPSWTAYVSEAEPTASALQWSSHISNLGDRPMTLHVRKVVPTGAATPLSIQFTIIMPVIVDYNLLPDQ